MDNSFYRELNTNTIQAIKRNEAFFMRPNDSYSPAITDALTGNPITGANYFNLRLVNDLSGKHYTKYVKMHEALSPNNGWASALRGDSSPRGIIYREENALLNPAYSFVMPAAELNQDIFRESRAKTHTGNYTPFQSHNTKTGSFDDLVHGQFTNAVNASLSGCPFRSTIGEQEMDQFKTRLVNEIYRNPAYMSDMADKASQEVMNFHYIPFDRNNFIERARDENSNEFVQLNKAINGHVHDMHQNRQKSFNAEFDELSRPLIINIDKLYMGSQNPQPAVDREISEFVKKSMRQDRAATVLADVFAGTFIEKAIKLVRTGKRIFAGIMLAGSLFNSRGTADDGIAGSIVESQYKIRENFSERDRVVINNRVFQGNELRNILNFDNAPFNLAGSGKIGSRDYEMAYQAEKSILNMHPAISRDEYYRDMANRQIINFYASAAHKMNAGSGMDFVNIAGRIMASQELKGNNALKSCSDTNNARSFFACLNQTIRDNPQTLDQAIARLNNSRQPRAHTATKSHAMQRQGFA